MYYKLSTVDVIIKNFRMTPTQLSKTLCHIAPKVLHVLTTTNLSNFDDVTQYHNINIDISSIIILKLSNKTDPIIQNVYEITYSRGWYLIYKSLTSISTEAKKSCITISQFANKKTRMDMNQRFSKFNLIIHVLIIMSQYFTDNISLHMMNIFFESVCDYSYRNIYSLSKSNKWILCYSIFCGSERFMIQCDDKSKYEIQKLALQSMSRLFRCSMISWDYKYVSITHDNYEFKILDRHQHKIGSLEFTTIYKNVQHDTVGIIEYSTNNHSNTNMNKMIYNMYYIVHNCEEHYDRYDIYQFISDCRSLIDAYIYKRYVFCSIPDEIGTIMF